MRVTIELPNKDYQIILAQIMSACRGYSITIEEQPHGEWIPCSERLPEEDDGYRVLVTVCISNRPLDIMILPTSTVKEVFEEGHILAWMPLLEPYKERGEAE